MVSAVFHKQLDFDAIFSYSECNSSIIQMHKRHNSSTFSISFNNSASRVRYVNKDIVCVNHATMQLCDICDQVADLYAIPVLLILIYFITTTTTFNVAGFGDDLLGYRRIVFVSSLRFGDLHFSHHQDYTRILQY
ncbi:Protein of unknown function [Cotesia congregata]|uniref:Uncharacterized protein n=1 Tax=Cotesia congregata TaxID=51543 RepID=A0A8J2H6Y9_COTCN|nr:Protein of unknown function [Cotesia congregata]